MATGLENLKIYTRAKELELEVFHLTKQFPEDEKYRSVDQLRRSSSSTTNNIAEAYNKQSIKEKIRIINDTAKCEAEETRRNLEVCLEKEFYKNGEIIERHVELIKMISGYVSFLRKNL
ncbi:MAG: four helix bundle protein [bacterium]|nr:four helix bundle protein [bacterium]